MFPTSPKVRGSLRDTVAQQVVLLAGFACLSAGCASPYYADRGALFGGIVGAGTGAIIGEALDNPLAGAAIGAGVGTLTGASVGAGLDEVEARNRAQIAAAMGRPVTAAAVRPQDVIAMTQAGVDDPLIITHIRKHGTAQPLSSNDLIMLKSNGVSAAVIDALQLSPGPQRGPVAGPAPVIIEEHYVAPPWPTHDPWCYDPPYYPPHARHRHFRHRGGPRVSWGISVHGH